MPVFTTASSLRARRASRPASLVTTMDNDTALTPKQPADPATRPTSPSVPLESESLVLKAKRAYEHDRQRAKKRKERAERQRERERNASESHPIPTQGAGRRTGTKLPRIALGAGFGMGDENASPLLSPGVEEIIADVVEREAQARGAVQPLEVHLEQFVKPNKTRKSKGEWHHPHHDSCGTRIAYARANGIQQASLNSFRACRGSLLSTTRCPMTPSLTSLGNTSPPTSLTRSASYPRLTPLSSRKPSDSHQLRTKIPTRRVVH